MDVSRTGAEGDLVPPGATNGLRRRRVARPGRGGDPSRSVLMLVSCCAVVLSVLLLASALLLPDLAARSFLAACAVASGVLGAATAVRAGRSAAGPGEVSDQRFHGLFSASPVGIGLADEEGRFAEVNQALCDILGRPAQDLLGRSSRGFTHPDDLDQHARAGAIIDQAPGGVARVEKRYLRPDGSEVWVWITVAHVPGPDGQRWTLAHTLDVTERKGVELQLQRSRSELEAVVAVAQCAQRGTDPRPVVVSRVLELSAAECVCLVERDGDELVATASVGTEVTGARVRLDATSVAAHVWRTGTGRLVPDVREEPLVDPALAALTGTRAVLCRPVVSGDDVVALLLVGWQQPRAAVPQHVVSAVDTVAAEAGNALHAERLRARLELLATTDPLTGLLNRRGWADATTAAMAGARRRSEPLSVVMADLDHFKAFNDTRGHDAGDDLLRALAAVVPSCFRADDVVGRWGGEEFVLALPGLDLDAATEAVARFAALVPEGQTASFGLARWDGAESLDRVVRRADEALYRAKQGGRARASR